MRCRWLDNEHRLPRRRTRAQSPRRLFLQDAEELQRNREWTGKRTSSKTAGIDNIRFDRPASTVFPNEVHTRGVAALERAAEGLRAKTVVHRC